MQNEIDTRKEAEAGEIQNPQPKRAWSVEFARERLRTLPENSVNDNRQNRLPFETLCAIFAFAYDGTPNRYLARAFGVSPATISHISGCLSEDPNPTKLEYQKGQNKDLDLPVQVPKDHNQGRKPSRLKRYDRVAREFETLGETEFFARYLTKDLYKTVAQARREMILEKGRLNA